MSDAISGEQLSVGATAVGFTSSLIHPSGAMPAYKALVVINVGMIRLRYDSTAPTSSVGILLESGSSFIIEGLPNLSQTQMISADGGTAEVFCTYERGFRL